MRRPSAPGAAALAVVALLVAGCTDVPGGDVFLLVDAAEAQPGDCTFGARDNASDPEWCHVLEVEISNGARISLDLGADKWVARDAEGHESTFPRVLGPDHVAAGERAELTLRFAATDDTPLASLHYEDPGAGVVADTTIRTY